MKAILELEKLGFTFKLDGDRVHYAHHGEQPDSERMRPLLDHLRQHRDEATRFLRERTLAPEFSADCPVTLRFPADAHVAVIDGHWRRLESGEIEATYPNREVSALALILMYDAKRRELEERLEKWLEIIRTHEGSDEELDRLQSHFTALLDERQTTLDHLRALKQEAAEFFTSDADVAHQEELPPWHDVTLDGFNDLADFMAQHGSHAVSSWWSGRGPVILVCGEELC